MPSTCYTATGPLLAEGDRIRLTATTATMLRPGDVGVVVSAVGTPDRMTYTAVFPDAPWGDGDVAFAARWGDRWEVIA
jgi:hypothetical protein